MLSTAVQAEVKSVTLSSYAVNVLVYLSSVVGECNKIYNTLEH